MRSSIFIQAAAALCFTGTLAAQERAIHIGEWQRGLSFERSDARDVAMFLWFYEWTLFDAIRSGQHTGGTYDFYRQVAKDGSQGQVLSSMFRLTATATGDGADLLLRVTNLTDSAWPELAGIIPCFNPGRAEGPQGGAHINPKVPQFADPDQRHTYFVGPGGLTPLVTRAIHFHHDRRAAIDRQARDGAFVFSDKWPTSPENAHAGLIVRESSQGKWVAGIAWEDYLSVQGHNPWRCMHHSVRVGPLKPNQTREIRGKIYLFPGTKEDLLAKHRRDFRR